MKYRYHLYLIDPPHTRQMRQLRSRWDLPDPQMSPEVFYPYWVLVTPYGYYYHRGSGLLPRVEQDIFRVKFWHSMRPTLVQVGRSIAVKFGIREPREALRQKRKPAGGLLLPKNYDAVGKTDAQLIQTSMQMGTELNEQYQQEHGDFERLDLWRDRDTLEAGIQAQERSIILDHFWNLPVSTRRILDKVPLLPAAFREYGTIQALGRR